MDKLTTTTVYLIIEPTQEFRRTDELVLADQSGDVLHYLEKREDMYVFSKTQMRDIMENIFDAAVLYERYGSPPDKEAYISSLL